MILHLKIQLTLQTDISLLCLAVRIKTLATNVDVTYLATQA